MENNTDRFNGQNKENQAIKIIFSIILFLICCIVVVAYSSYAYINSVATTWAVAMTDTQAAATNSTATAQGYTTATSVAYSTQIAEYLIFDDFDSNLRRWYSNSAEANKYWEGSIGVQDGLYVWDVTEVKDQGSFSWRSYDGQGAYQNFDLSVDVKLEKGSPELLCYGIAFRASPRSFNSGAYILSICDAGVFEVKYHNKEADSEVISPWQQTNSIRSGEWNTISVKAQDEKIFISINHSVVLKFEDKHTAKGYVYLILRMFDDQPGTVYFDNFAFQPH